ncbi:MAG: WYL domain-containing protein [Thermaceae bacterium]|nr:WYL domain-containing protein [Thermaceae bacterium]
MAESKRETANHRKALRLVEAKELLRAKPYTATELARVLNVDKRTALRYLEDLQAVELEEGKRPPQYKLLENQDLNPVEVLVTHSALRLLYHHTPGYNPIYFSALNKLARRLLEPAQSVALKSTEDLKQRFTSWDEGETLARVAEAWFKRRTVEFDYVAPGGSGTPRKNRVDIYFIEIARTNLALYVIGYEHGYHRALRTYKLGRMDNLEYVTPDEAYTVPADFDPRKYLSNAWGVVGTSGGKAVEVRLRFRKDAAYRVEEGGYPNLHIDSRNPDGSLEVHITVGTNKNNFPLELLSWVQSWGPRVEVLEPEELRKRWLEEARMVSKIGEDNGQHP